MSHAQSGVLDKACLIKAITRRCDAAGDLFSILADREHRAATIIASQTGPAHWAVGLPDKLGGESIVNRMANNGRAIQIGGVDMRQIRGHEVANAL